jgi:hypothetical protein
MTQRSSSAAATRAAHAALPRPASAQDFDRYVLVEETDDGSEEIRTLLRERSPRLASLTP